MTAIQERLYEDSTMVALKDLRLDPLNVRFRHITRTMSENEMEEWLETEEDVRVLTKQIIRDRRIQQPIYVIEDGQGKYVVKEGNRRTASLRLIQRDLIKGKIKGFEKDHFDLVPVHILKGTEHAINIFLGQIHVSGPKEWNAVNKGAQIHDLIEEYGDTFEGVAEELGMTKGVVEKYYKSFIATKHYSKRYPQDKNPVPKFSYFAELYQSKVLKNWLNEDPANLDYFIDLVGNNKLLVTYKGVRAFAKIVASPAALKVKAIQVLDSSDGDIDKAIQVLDNNTTSKGVWSMVSKLHKSLYGATFDDLTSSVDASKIELLKDTIANLEAKLQVIQKLESKESAVA